MNAPIASPDRASPDALDAPAVHSLGTEDRTMLTQEYLQTRLEWERHLDRFQLRGAVGARV